MKLLTKLANRCTEMAGKKETVKELAAAFYCPPTSLYLPIKELESIDLLKLWRGKSVVYYSGFEEPLIKELKSSEIF